VAHGYVASSSAAHEAYLADHPCHLTSSEESLCKSVIASVQSGMKCQCSCIEIFPGRNLKYNCIYIYIYIYTHTHIHTHTHTYIEEQYKKKEGVPDIKSYIPNVGLPVLNALCPYC